MGLEDSAATDSGANILLNNILSTLQRLEQHFEEQNTRLSSIAFSAGSRSRPTSPSTEQWRFRGNRPRLQWSPNDSLSGTPVTPPDSQTESPVTPYAHVVSELRDKFPFVDSDDESDASAPSIPSRNANRGQLRDAPNERGHQDQDEGSQVDDIVNEYDGSIYSSQLLSSHLALPTVQVSSRTAKPGSFTYDGRNSNHTTDSRPYHAIPVTILKTPQETAGQRGFAHRSSGLRRSLSSRKDRVLTWTKARLSQDSGRPDEVLTMERGQTWVEWSVDETRSRTKALLKAPRRFWDKMTVTRVFYP